MRRLSRKRTLPASHSPPGFSVRCFCLMVACGGCSAVLAWFSNVGLPPVSHPQLAELHELISEQERKANAWRGKGSTA